jgi:dihydrofolate reductase
MPAPIEIRGYAIVSDDDKIAAADDLMPPSMRNERDWEYYQRALSQADVVVFGRRSHEKEPKLPNQRRVVVSREAKGLEERADAWWWNPTNMRWPEVVDKLLPYGGLVGAPGGQVVFDLFLEVGFDEFHMSRAHGVALPGGRFVFSACEGGASAAAVLGDAGLTVSERIALDPANNVDMTIWRRPG